MLVVSTMIGVSVWSAAATTAISAATSPIAHHEDARDVMLTPAPPTIMSAIRTALSTNESLPESGYSAITVIENQYTHAPPDHDVGDRVEQRAPAIDLSQQDGHRHERDERGPQDAVDIDQLHRRDDDEGGRDRHEPDDVRRTGERPHDDLRAQVSGEADRHRRLSPPFSVRDLAMYPETRRIAALTLSFRGRLVPHTPHAGVMMIHQIRSEQRGLHVRRQRGVDQSRSRSDAAEGLRPQIAGSPPGCSRLPASARRSRPCRRMIGVILRANQRR